jgi:hypothetical protein
MARLLALVFLASAGLIGTAAGQPLRLGYEAYAGGLHVMSLDVSIEQRSTDYRVATDLHTRGLADFFIGMRLDSQASGRIEHGDLQPFRYLNQGKFGRRERTLTVEPRPDGGFLVQTAPAPQQDEERTPIPAASLPGSIDPLTAILRASRTVAGTGSCRQRVPVFDGRRRYDLVFTDEGERQLTPSRYSVFAGPARLCRVHQERIGGFLKETGDKELGQDSVLWIASPLAGAPPVPVRLELDTSWGWLTIHLGEVSGETGTVRLARDAGAK